MSRESRTDGRTDDARNTTCAYANNDKLRVAPVTDWQGKTAGRTTTPVPVVAARSVQRLLTAPGETTRAAGGPVPADRYFPRPTAAHCMCPGRGRVVAMAASSTFTGRYGRCRLPVNIYIVFTAHSRAGGRVGRFDFPASRRHHYLRHRYYRLLFPQAISRAQCPHPNDCSEKHFFGSHCVIIIAVDRLRLYRRNNGRSISPPPA